MYVSSYSISIEDSVESLTLKEIKEELADGRFHKAILDNIVTTLKVNCAPDRPLGKLGVPPYNEDEPVNCNLVIVLEALVNIIRADPKPTDSWQEGVQKELAQLEGRIESLEDFIDCGMLPLTEKKHHTLLPRQLLVMRKYARILRQRLED
jgi:hypothetical protein